MNIKINNIDFTATLQNNKAVEKLFELLPLEITMQELNGNEKYYYLDVSFPTQSERVGTINAGDIMLYGDNCLVIFYKTFSTPYSYTKIGHIDNIDGLENALGTNSIKVVWSK